uniref:cyclin-dependent kinase n=1 Tax=Parastrongyloides trichosuri TaxID=131310 RepID=A0A0N5A2B3_PARTI
MNSSCDSRKRQTLYESDEDEVPMKAAKNDEDNLRTLESKMLELYSEDDASDVEMSHIPSPTMDDYSSYNDGGECMNLDYLRTLDFDELTDVQKKLFSQEELEEMEENYQKKLIASLPTYYAGISGCRSVNEYKSLNRIQEGTFGVVFRAQCKRTDEIVAMKKLKMDKEKDGFPITSIREINMLLKCGSHPNIVSVKEIVVGDNMDSIYMVMEYVEHDMKSLLDYLSQRNKNFTISQVKCLMKQLLSGIEHLHSEWILHRDLKTSNLLMNHRGILKIGDFGLAREYGDPLKRYTSIVVTLWYRSPELLLESKYYSTPIDMWSAGCIFAEFLTLKPLFPGRGELEQIRRIYEDLGTPTEKMWPGYSSLPLVERCTLPNHPYNKLRSRIGGKVLTDKGYKLLNRFLTYDPLKRITAEEALKHEWFDETPYAVFPGDMPTWPAKSELSRVPKESKKKDARSIKTNRTSEELALLKGLNVNPNNVKSSGFALRFDAPKFK